MELMAYAADQIQQASTLYLKDFDVLTEEQILASPGGSARRPIDFTYEVAILNLLFASRLLGEPPPPMTDSEGWDICPSEYSSKAKIQEFFKESSATLISAARSVPESEAEKVVGPPERSRTAFHQGVFASMHIMYHDAQLNYVQSLAGDLEWHWK